ncbi:hypothetical protein ALO78_200367 [Pseudomonas amygdali pv. ciccaronei]|nr:hypothetical protein ALO78_200367 [Pseudomonas amygdali pv. ciccaronei]
MGPAIGAPSTVTVVPMLCTHRYRQVLISQENEAKRLVSGCVPASSRASSLLRDLCVGAMVMRTS